MDAVTHPPIPVNEPVLDYAPGSPERANLVEALEAVKDPVELGAIIGGVSRRPAGEPFEVVAPFDHRRILATSANSTQADAADAVRAALAAAAGWRALDFDSRAAILLRAADLLAGPWRARVNAATMLGQAKTAYQAEIDSACELADFWRFNVHFARQILEEQPMANARGIWNRTDHRPLEGFVYAVTPFNFTAIAGNLPTAPALMGNVVVWKPSITQQLAAPCWRGSATSRSSSTSTPTPTSTGTSPEFAIDPADPRWELPADDAARRDRLVPARSRRTMRARLGLHLFATKMKIGAGVRERAQARAARVRRRRCRTARRSSATPTTR